MTRRLIMCLVLMGLIPAVSMAQQQGKITGIDACQDWLQIEKMHAYRIDEHRDKLEQEKASMEYALYQEQQKRKALEKELEALKKPQEKATP